MSPSWAIGWSFAGSKELAFSTSSAVGAASGAVGGVDRVKDAERSTEVASVPLEEGTDSFPLLEDDIRDRS